jgi:outer membrane protein OmpA-like peptidoglycan-associated protein
VRYHFLEAAAPPPQAQPEPVEPARPKTYIVFFDFNKSNLTSEAQSVVAEAAEAFKATGSVRIQVTGHTDTVGSSSYNQRLSERRAATVRAELVRLGVADDVITTEGRGFSDPMVPTGPGVREPQNRRAVIDLQ